MSSKAETARAAPTVGDFDQTVPSHDEPILQIPVVGLADLNACTTQADELLEEGMELGAFWLDTGDNEALADTEQIFKDVGTTFDIARTAKHWERHRFSTPKNKYLEALMHSVHAGGTHHFERPNFETISAVFERAIEHCPDCLEDIPPSIKAVRKLVNMVSDQVFNHMDRILGVESNCVGGEPTTRMLPITLHRVQPAKEPETKKVAAQEHFDFTLANILLYNYVEGFKVYQSGKWYRLGEPPKKNMLLFNLGSVLSVRSSRRISALFHRVDTPLQSNQSEPRLSLVCPCAPALLERIATHPRLIRPEDPEFEAHTYAQHVFYASKNYTKLNKHVIFEEGGKVSAPGIRFDLKVTAVAAVRAKLRYTFETMWTAVAALLQSIIAPDSRNYFRPQERAFMVHSVWATIMFLLLQAVVAQAFS